jgi:DNA-binding beta-propeller fold protein YncE
MACKHGNGRDWWILNSRYNDTLIYKILVTPDTIIVSSQVIGSAIYYELFGSSIFTPDGSKYIVMTQNNLLDIFDFNRCDGMLSNYSVVHLPDTVLSYFGATVSPDNHYLYVNTQLEIYQIDLNVNPYSSSITQVAQWDTFYSPFQTYFFLIVN